MLRTLHVVRLDRIVWACRDGRQSQESYNSEFELAGSEDWILNHSEARVRKAGLLVYTSVFPNSAQPGLGLFVRERMFRVGQVRPLKVVAPVPWFPFQSLVRIWKPHFRPTPPRSEFQLGVEVLHPRFPSIPGLVKWLDGWSMALASWRTVKKLRERFDFKIIDSHFAYPDGIAAVFLGRRLRLPVTITLRGTEVPLSRFPWRRRLLVSAVNQADRVFCVANSLKCHMGELGARTEHILRVGNGVDTTRFQMEEKAEARRRMGVPQSAQVLIGVGGLSERKGFHRVIEQLPVLIENHPNLVYIIVGGSGPEGDWEERLRTQTQALGVAGHVRMFGHCDPDELRWPLSAADVFVLSTRNEGWANVFLEAMACGLPVVTTDVGGNREVVCGPELGTLVPFDDGESLQRAVDDALRKDWDKEVILHYARDNDWSERVRVLDREFERLAAHSKKHLS